MLRRLAKLKEIQAKGGLPPKVNIYHPLLDRVNEVEAPRRPRYHHQRELNRLRDERQAELERQAKAEQERLDRIDRTQLGIITEHAKKCWAKLIWSRDFKRNANHNWLHFDRFIEDIGMPKNTKQKLFKDPRHVHYTKFSIKWVGG